jgi:Fe2+ transport system protein FeoA
MRRRLKKLRFHHRRHHLRKSTDSTGEVLLSSLRAGEKGVVLGINGGRGVLQRMTSLGFVPGTEVVILRNFGRGPIIVRIHDAHIALGRSVAGRIQMRRGEA